MASFRYIAFHKPFNVLSQFTAGATEAKTGSFRLTLAHFIDVKGVYPVGRLDQDSEGLMLLTDDGEMQHRLTNPRFEHPRTYLVQVEGIPTPKAIQNLRQGVCIQGYTTRQCKAMITGSPDLPERIPPVRVRKSIPTAWMELTLTEGRNRQVRRMTAAVGFPTLRLIRVAIGPLCLKALEPGQWRTLTQLEMNLLHASKGGHRRPPLPSR